MDVLEFAALVAVIFALLSFLNTLGMHLAIRVIRRRVDVFLSDPLGAALAALDANMADPERKKLLEARLQWMGRQIVTGAKRAFTDPVEPGPDGTVVKRPKGMIGKLLGALEFAQATGILGGGAGGALGGLFGAAKPPVPPTPPPPG